MQNIWSYLISIWRDLRALPFKLMRDREALTVLILILLPWLILLLYKKDLSSLQPLLWIIGLIAFYWLIGHRRELTLLELHRPRLELGVALGLAALWMLYRVGEFWHWYPIPTFGLNANSCNSLGDTAVIKTLEMFVIPVAFLFILKYSFSQMGLTFNKFSWLAAILPIAAWIIFGLINHPWKSLAFSSACFFFAAGLPEEFLFRAFLQTRFEAVLRRPLLAAFLASFVFGLSHIPINLGGTFSHWQDALLTAFTYQMAVGFALGYAYMRARDILPLALIHTLIDSAV